MRCISTEASPCPHPTRYAPPAPFAAAVDAVRRGHQSVAEAAAALAGRLTDDELLWLLDGDLTMLRGITGMSQRYNSVPFAAGRIDRLGIPGIRFTDGPRGITLGTSTAFPVALARAATWDPELECAVADVIGAEARAQGANLWAGICVNLAPAPGWGRTQESHGEDPLLLGAMGAAAVRGQAVVDDLREAFRPELDGGGEVPGRRPGRRDVLRRCICRTPRRRGGRGGLRDERLQLRQRDVGGAEPVPAHRHPARGLGLRRIRDDRLRLGLRIPSDRSARPGPGDALSPAACGRPAGRPWPPGPFRAATSNETARRHLSAQIRLARRARPTPPMQVVASARHRRLAREAASRGGAAAQPVR